MRDASKPRWTAWFDYSFDRQDRRVEYGTCKHTNTDTHRINIISSMPQSGPQHLWENGLYFLEWWCPCKHTQTRKSLYPKWIALGPGLFLLGGSFVSNADRIGLMRSLDALCCTQTHTGNHIHTRTLLNRPQTLLQPRFFCCISYPSMVTLSCECCHTLSISCLMCWLPFHDMLLLTTPQNNPCISSHVQSFIVCNMRYLCIKVLSVPSKNRIIAIIIHLERSDCVQ